MVQLPGKAFIAHNILRIMFSVKKPAQAVHFVLSSFIVLTLFGGKNNQTVPQMQGNPSQGENAKRLLVSVKADHVKLSFPLSSSVSFFYCGSTEQFPTVSTKVFFFFFVLLVHMCKNKFYYGTPDLYDCIRKLAFWLYQKIIYTAILHRTDYC